MCYWPPPHILLPLTNLRPLHQHLFDRIVSDSFAKVKGECKAKKNRDSCSHACNLFKLILSCLTLPLRSSTVALTTSTTNIVILGVLGGTELGWLCLAACGVDVIVNALSIFWVTGIIVRPHRTVSIYSTRTDQFRPSSGPVQSILKRPSTSACTSSQTLYQSGRHLITSVYDRFKEESTYSSSSRPIESVSLDARRWSRSSFVQDPSHPFARASYIPQPAEPQVEINGNPHARSPSALRSFADRFWPLTVSQDPDVKNVEISVTTTVDVESFHESPLWDLPPPFQSSQPRRTRSCSI